MSVFPNFCSMMVLMIVYGMLTSLIIIFYLSRHAVIKEHLNQDVGFIRRIKTLLFDNKEDETMNVFILDDHNHEFSAENRVNVCEIFDVIKSVDVTVNTLNSQLFCDDKAYSSDLVCRWFFYQADLPENNMCRRTSKDNMVPKIVYYVIFGTYTFKFWEYISVLSAKKFIKPSAIYVIGNAHPKGVWWERVMSDIKGVRFIYREKPKIGNWTVKWIQHLSDVVRLQVLLVNGGIYLDTDMIIIRPVDSLLNDEITLGLLDNATGMGNAFILARRGSPFVLEWYKQYTHFKREKLFGNSLQVPRDMWIKNPKSVNLVSDLFYRPNWFEADLLFEKNDYPWRNNFAVHVWTNGKRVPSSPAELNNRNTTVVQIFKHVLYGSSESDSDS